VFHAVVAAATAVAVAACFGVSRGTKLALPSVQVSHSKIDGFCVLLLDDLSCHAPYPMLLSATPFLGLGKLI